MDNLIRQTPSCSSLREPNAIVLISCYELGHQPIGIAQPMGFLERAGYAPATLDIAVEPLDHAQIRRARFIGISVPMHTALTLGLQIAKTVREINPACHICFYGLYASLNDQYLLDDVADTVIGGEYEIPLINLIKSLGQPGTGKANALVEGVSYRGRLSTPFLKRISWRISSLKPDSPQAEFFPLPSRNTLVQLDHYAHLEHHEKRHLAGYVEASRGCLHHCRHCPIVPVYQGRLFLIPAEVLLEDIQQQVRAGAAHITFGDPDFLNGPGHSLKIVRAMNREFPNLTFDFTAKIEHILKQKALLPEFKARGCLFIISAVESFSDMVLEHLQKGHTRKDVLDVLDLVREAGITLRPSLVAFTPWTTLDDYLDMVKLVESNDLIDAIDPIQYTIRLLVPPGSALLDAGNGQTHPMRGFITALDQPKFQHRWKHPDPRMDLLHEETAALVAQNAKEDIDPLTTFDTLRALAFKAAGLEPPMLKVSASHPSPSPKPPRMTEPWFCCAEPREEQFQFLRPHHSPGV